MSLNYLGIKQSKVKASQEVATKQAVFNTSERENTDEEGRNAGGERKHIKASPFLVFFSPGLVLVCSYISEQSCFVSPAILVLFHGTLS